MCSTIVSNHRRVYAPQKKSTTNPTNGSLYDAFGDPIHGHCSTCPRNRSETHLMPRFGDAPTNAVPTPRWLSKMSKVENVNAGLPLKVAHVSQRFRALKCRPRSIFAASQKYRTVPKPTVLRVLLEAVTFREKGQRCGWQHRWGRMAHLTCTNPILVIHLN